MADSPHFDSGYAGMNRVVTVSHSIYPLYAQRGLIEGEKGRRR